MREEEEEELKSSTCPSLCLDLLLSLCGFFLLLFEGGGPGLRFYTTHAPTLLFKRPELALALFVKNIVSLVNRVRFSVPTKTGGYTYSIRCPVIIHDLSMLTLLQISRSVGPSVRPNYRPPPLIFSEEVGYDSRKKYRFLYKTRLKFIFQLRNVLNFFMIHELVATKHVLQHIT